MIIDKRELFLNKQYDNGFPPDPQPDVFSTPGLDYNHIIFAPHLPDELAKRLEKDND